MQDRTQTIAVPPIEPGSAYERYRTGTPPMSTELANEAEAQLDAIAAAITPPTCPSWCERGEHKFECISINPAQFTREHVMRVSDHVWIEAVDELTPEGLLTTGEPGVWIRGVPTEDQALDAATAYNLGDDLNSAAHRLEKIAAAQL
jgi:hypothetical protein